jgi:probable HAF family extracellular repeat protein
MRPTPTIQPEDALVLNSRPLPGRVAGSLFLVLLASACDRDVVAPSAPLAHSAHSASLVTNDGALNIGTLGGDQSFAHAANSMGLVVGEAQVTPGSPWPHAFIWTSAGGMFDVGHLVTTSGVSTSRLVDVNDAGQAVGQSSADGGARAVIWTTGMGIRALPSLPGWFGDYAEAINQAGVIAGGTQLAGTHNVVMWADENTPVLIGKVPGDLHTHAHDINASGQIVGHSLLPPPANTNGSWIWSGSTGFQRITPFAGGSSGSANAINDAGQVVGWVNAPGGGVAYLWTEAGGMVNLGKLADAFTCMAEDINNQGVVTGRCFTPSGQRAFIWTQADGMTDMGPGAGTGLNEHGLMVGNSDNNIARVWSYSVTADPETPEGVYSLMNGRLVRVDPVTGVATVTMTPTRDPACCVTADDNGWIYATHSDPRFPRTLMRMRPAAGLTQQVASLSQSFAAMEFHPTRGLLGVDFNGLLWTVNKTTGAVTPLTSLGSGPGVSIQDLAVLEDGTIYGIRVDVGDMTRGIPAKGTTLFKVNPTTFARADIKNFGTNVFMTGLTDLGGDLLTAECGKIMVIDPSGNIKSSRNVGNGMDCLIDLTTFGEVALDPVDVTPPAIVPTVSGTLGLAGWYVSDVTVSWGVNDTESAVTSQSGCGTTVVNQDTQSQSFTCSATSAGGSDSKTVTVKRDATDPVITFAGNAGTYTIDQTVSISCTATDATSDIASTSCGSATNTPAYQLGAGEFTFEASAADNAGNSTVASASFTVVVTHAGICALTRSFSNSSSVADGLCDKLAAAESAGARGNDKAAANILDAYRNQLRAQTGKAISAANAQVLLNLLATL